MFVTFEGIEGSSKTTQAGLLSEWLQSNEIEHVLTKEPGTVLSKECQQIRKLLLSPENDLSHRTELLLYLADRAQHVNGCIVPALNEGKWVISDRYSLSTEVYQGIGRGFGNDLGPMFDNLLYYAQYGVFPAITFLMDLPVEIGLQRARTSNQEFQGGDRMERETLEFHQKLRDGFLSKVEGRNGVVILDATKSIQELHEEVKQVLQPFMV